MSKKKTVDLSKLRLGMNNEGRVFVGIPDENGMFDDDMIQDVTDDFQGFMKTTLALATITMQKKIQEEAKKTKIRLASIGDIAKVSKKI